jgi:hypothetical protein
LTVVAHVRVTGAQGEAKAFNPIFFSRWAAISKKVLIVSKISFFYATKRHWSFPLLGSINTKKIIVAPWERNPQ